MISLAGYFNVKLNLHCSGSHTVPEMWLPLLAVCAGLTYVAGTSHTVPEMRLPLLVVCAGLTYVAGIARNYTIDLSGSGCDNILDYQLKDKDDLATVYSVRQRNAAGSRDHCDLTVSTVQGSRIQYLIEVIQFDECGQEINIYDDRTFDSALLRHLRCTDNNNVPLFGKSKDDVIRLRVRKPMPEQNLFEFRMRLKNDLGPDFAYQKAQPLHSTGQMRHFTHAADLLTITLFLTLLFLK